MTGKKNYKELETEKQKGKRRFVERRIQELEAEKEIKEYDSEHRDDTNEVNVHQH